MSYALAAELFALVTFYFVLRDNCYKSGFETGSTAKQKTKLIKQDKELDSWQKVFRLQKLQEMSQENLRSFGTKLASMFSSRQSKNVKVFLRDMYESQADAVQQLYFLLSLDFIEKKHFIQLVKAWMVRKQQGEKIDQFCHNAFYHALESGELGTWSANDFRTAKVHIIDGQRVKVDRIREVNQVKKLDFLNMNVKETDVPFTPFSDDGLRYCTAEIKAQIDFAIGKPLFQKHMMLDLTPISLYFVCLIANLIPTIDLAFLNAPFEPKIAKKIYPKVWKAWRENRIKELVFLGNNNWTSDECNADRPGWFLEHWEAMKPYMQYITITYVKGNFVNGVTNEVIDGPGKKCCLVHCKRH